MTFISKCASISSPRLQSRHNSALNGCQFVGQAKLLRDELDSANVANAG